MEAIDDYSAKRDLLLPVLAGSTGLLLRVIDALGYRSAAGGSLVAQALVLLAVETLLTTLALAMGVLGLMKATDFELGPPLPALGKVAALFLLASGFGHFAAGLDPDPAGVNGMVVAWHVVAIVYPVGLWVLFKADVLEAAAGVVFLGVPHLFVAWLLAARLPPELAGGLMFQ